MNNTVLTVIGFLIVFVATTLGAALVFFIKGEVSDEHNATFCGLAAGIMAAASVFSLLLPSIESFEYLGGMRFLPTMLAFLAGGAFFAVTDLFVKRVIMKNARVDAEVQKPFRMFAAMTIHNLPEGLAVGFAFGSAAFGGIEQALAALGLAVGIAVQNFPEGAAVAMPMRKAVSSPFKAFLFGAGSGLIEPVAAVVGFLFSTALFGLLPYVMAFSAGTMIFVVVEDLLPETGSIKHTAWGFMIGFAIMMALDVSL